MISFRITLGNGVTVKPAAWTMCTLCVIGIACHMTYVMSKDKRRVSSVSLDCLECKCVQSTTKEQDSPSYPVCIRAMCL